MQRLVPLVAIAALIGPGCAYVGQAAFEAKRDGLDHDGDGAPYGGPDRDCDDFEKLESPNNDEIPYDGYDNDCDGADIVDADGDGFPGILKADYLALNKDAEWPASVVEGPIDCADDVAIWPDAALIFPGNANDAVYDGKDSDCAGDNDYDADGDGYMPTEHEDAFGTYVAAWGLDALAATAQFGDCNDFRPEANPGTDPGADAWYDGHDDDCAGDNDYDADGDGFMFDETTNTQGYEDFVDLYHPTGAPWDEDWGDCLDQVDAAIPAQPEDVWPGNPSDDPYDGVDADCLCDNDFDADGDGVMPDDANDPGAHGGRTFDDYDAAWGCALPADFGDCDDADPLTAPGALERLDDAADSDCDGDADSTPFGFGVQRWYAPRRPRVIETANHFMLLTTSELATPDQVAVKQWNGIALPFALDAGYLASPSGAASIWMGSSSPFPMGEELDGAAVGDDWWGAASYYYQNSLGYISLKQMTWAGTQYTVGSTEWGMADVLYSASGVDIVMDSNAHAWAVSCGPEQFQVLRGDNNTATTSTADISPTVLDPDGVPAGVCFWNAVPIPSGSPGAFSGIGEVVICEPGVDCDLYEFDSGAQTLALAAVNPWAGRQLAYGDFRDGWHILLESGTPGVRVEGPGGAMALLTGWNVSAVDAGFRDTDGSAGTDEVWAAVVAEPIIDDGLGPRVVVAWGPNGGPWTERVIPFTHPTRTDLALDGVGVAVSDDRFVLAVSALATDTVTDPGFCMYAGNPVNADVCLPDVVGWTFFGLP